MAQHISNFMRGAPKEGRDSIGCFGNACPAWLVIQASRQPRETQCLYDKRFLKLGDERFKGCTTVIFAMRLYYGELIAFDLKIGTAAELFELGGFGRNCWSGSAC